MKLFSMKMWQIVGSVEGCRSKLYRGVKLEALSKLVSGCVEGMYCVEGPYGGEAEVNGCAEEERCVEA